MTSPPTSFRNANFSGAGIERDEVDLHGPFALAARSRARPRSGSRPLRVLAVGDDQQVLPEHAGAIEIRPRLAHRLADGRAAAGPRQLAERRAERRAIVRLDRPQRADAAREAVEPDLDRESQGAWR